MKDEREKKRFNIHPSSLIPHPSKEGQDK